MATITTTSVTNPLLYPATTLLDYTTYDSYWYAMVKASTSNTYEVWRTNTGTSWSLYVSLVRANIQEIGSIYTSPQGWISWCYRTNESNQDRIYYRRLSLSAGTWSPEVLLSGNANGGVAGAVWGGMDLVTIDYGPSNSYQAGMAIVAQTDNGGAWLMGFNSLPGANPQANNGVMSGNRQFLPVTAVAGHHTPSIDLEHAGNGKVASVSHLWTCYGRNQILLNKIAWTGVGWSVPTGMVAITGAISNRDYAPGRWDGNRFLMVRPSGSTVILYERNRANTGTTTRTTGAHTQGTVRSASVSYNNQSGNPRVYAVGTSTNDLYYVDYDRSLGTWGAWTLVTSVDITGANVDNFSPRRGTYVNAKHDILTAHAGVDIVHTALSQAFVPLVPTWVFSAVPYVSGSAADVNAALLLDWQFNDPDPADTQSAYALSRQIGSDTIEYWQASTGTWQSTEQKNTSTTTQVTLPTGFVDRFDLGVSGSWVTTASTFVATTTQARSGGKAALLTTVGTPTQAFVRYELPAVVGTSYSAELWGLSTGGYANFGVAIDWYTSGHVYISTSASAGTALSAGVWGRRSVTATAPATTAFAQVGPTVGGSPPASTLVYVDDVSFGATPTPWAAASDATHSYKVKTWDSTDVASLYSASLTLVPSAKVNPTILTPPDSSTWSTGSLTITWSASEQTAFQAKLIFVGITLEDTGKRVSSATTWTFDEVLIDSWNYSIQLYTWNNEGLQSDVAQNNISVRFVAPRIPTITVSPDPARGYNTVAVSNPPASTFNSVGAAATGNNTTLNPALPATTATGDLLLVYSAIENSGTGTPNTPSGYTSLGTFANIGLYGKIQVGGETAPSVSYTGGVAGAATTAQVAGFDESALIALGGTFSQLNGSAQDIAYAGGTPPTANCIMILMAWKQDGAATNFGTPAGFTKIGQTFNANGQSTAWYYQIQTTATAVSGGTITVTSGVSAISRSLLVAVSGVPNVLYNDIWRIRTGSFGDQIRVIEGVAVNGSGNDWRALSKQPYHYQAIAIGANGTTALGLFTP